MEIEVQLTGRPIPEAISATTPLGARGAWLEFRGVVRDEEGGHSIAALEYEAYPEMAVREMRRILESLDARFPCLAARVIHRVGVIPAGEAAIYVGIAAAHRGEAIALLREFMDRLKQDVPIWKRGAVAAASSPGVSPASASPSPAGEERPEEGAVHGKPAARAKNPLSLDEALAEISARCAPCPAVHMPLAEAFGHVLRETVRAPGDLPDCDRSTRDGYAVLIADPGEVLRVVDTLHAADWRPRRLQRGETVRIATGAALPCGNLRVVMQENVERIGDTVKILRAGPDLNIRKRGEEAKAGQTLMEAGALLDAGGLALLASAGCVHFLLSPRLQVVHFTTGDEIVPPEKSPAPGQVRDSNSILIRGLLQKFPCEIIHAHLPEDFERARAQIADSVLPIGGAGLLLVSGGASVGEKDFTRELLAWLGFDIVFHRVNLRPVAPLIYGMKGNRAAFGLPGNPLSHFICFHLFVAAALAIFTGARPRTFQRGPLAESLDEALCPRETLWPARQDATGLRPLPWRSSGDMACLAQTNALVRVPANCANIAAGAEVEFLPT